jgi:hypothetical protein
MSAFATLAAAERRLYLEQVATRLGVVPVIVEKGPSYIPLNSAAKAVRLRRPDATVHSTRRSRSRSRRMSGTRRGAREGWSSHTDLGRVGVGEQQDRFRHIGEGFDGT